MAGSAMNREMTTALPQRTAIRMNPPLDRPNGRPNRQYYPAPSLSEQKIADKGAHTKVHRSSSETARERDVGSVATYGSAHRRSSRRCGRRAARDEQAQAERDAHRADAEADRCEVRRLDRGVVLTQRVEV